MDLNRATIIGNVTKEPELRVTATAQKVCSFSIATNQSWTDAQGQKHQKTEYHNIVAWGKLAEICGQYLGRGMKTYVEGRLQTREWEAQDGQKKQRTEIVAENVILLGPKKSQDQVASQPAPETATQGQEVNLSDIPF